MIQIIIVIIVVLLLFSLVSKIISAIGELLAGIIGIGLIIGVIALIISNFSFVFTIIKWGIKIFLLLMILAFVVDIIEKIQIKKWLNQPIPTFNTWQLEDIVLPYSNTFYNADKNLGAKFSVEDLPLGRINSFLNYYGLNIYEENPIYYSAQRSKTDIELREYGTVVTHSGIYISKQLNEVNENNEYKVTEIKIPFKGLWKTSINENELEIKYIKDKKAEVIKIKNKDVTLPLDVIKSMCDEIIESKLSLAILSNKVVSRDDYEEAISRGDDNFRREQRKNNSERISNVSGIMGATSGIIEELNNTKNYMNGSRGHGYGSEYGNNTLDKLTGKKVINAAQQLDENGRQVKHGADRIVNGSNIQTKYYKTASESIGAAFQNKNAIYLNDDGSMMQIEVPRDQYAKACDIMQKRIDKGEVPGAKPGDDPRKYVRKGYLTYEQSYNICKSGSLESLTIDAINGAITSSVAGGITALTVFAFAVWNGEDAEAAAKAGMAVGIKVIGRGAFIYTLTMQLSRDQFINPFVKQYTKDGVCQGFAGIDNPIFKLSENVANNINKSALGKSSVGKKLGLDTVKGNKVIASGITVLIVFGPDICRALAGRISTKQLFKNATVGAAGIGGGILGQILIPIPYVGAMIGGGVSSFVAKKILDEFIEDDAKEMFQILKEEFLDVVMMSNLNSEEFDEVVNETLCNKNLSKILRDMYSAGDSREFAREAFISVAVINVISKRELITEETVQEGFNNVIYKTIENVNYEVN